MKHDVISSSMNFGLTSGVITTLGLIVGLHAGTHSMLVVIGGILTIAVADSMSDALGMHISKESDGVSTTREVWLATVVTFFTKMSMSLTFIIPVMLLELDKAVYASIAWGMLVIALLSFIIARRDNNNPVYVVGEHLTITVIVIVATHTIGDWVSYYFI